MPFRRLALFLTLSAFALPLTAAEKRKKAPAAPAVNSGAPTALPAGRQAPASKEGDIFKMRDSVRVKPEDTVNGNVVVVGAAAIIEGHVTEDVVVVGGRAFVTGTIDGDLVVLGPSADLGPQAVVGRDFVAIGTMVRNQPGSRIHGRTITLHGLRLLAVLASIASMLAFATMWLRLFSVIGWMLLAGIFAWLASKALSESADQLRRRPVTSLVLGLLFWPATAFAFAALVVSILGIPLTPLLAVLCGLACVWGYLAAGEWLGQIILPRAQTGWLPCFVGVGALQIVGWLPFGRALNGLALVFGLGATVLWTAGRLYPGRRDSY